MSEGGREGREGDTQEGVLADSMSHQSNNSITKILQHI